MERLESNTVTMKLCKNMGIDLVKEKVMEQISLKVRKIGWHKKI